MADQSVTDGTLTDKTAPVLADKLLLVNSEATPDALTEMELTHLLKIITLHTEDTAPQLGDAVATYDASASAPKSVKLYNLLASLPDGTVLNGKISPTVSASDLILALKTWAGSDPSSADPALVKINGTWRSVTAALSVTLADGTNWFNAGAAELATLEQDYFSYLGWRAASSAVVIGFSRIPYGRVYSDFSGTSTNEKYAAFSTAPASTDDVVNTGRFGATLSAGAAYTWTVPTYTNVNLRQSPIYETRWRNWVPTLTGFSANPTDTLYEYKIEGDKVLLLFSQFTNGTSNGTGFTATPPFGCATTTNATWGGTMHSAVDNGAALTVAARAFISATAPSTITLQTNMAGGAWTGSAGKRAIFNMWYRI